MSCSASAKTNNQIRVQRSLPGPHGPVLSCSYEVNWSRPSISSTPSALLSSIFVVASSPGSSSEKALAASIIPTAKPSRLSSTRCGNPRSHNAGTAPSAVVANHAAPPSMARRNPAEALPPANCTMLWVSSASTPNRAGPKPSAAGVYSRAVFAQQRLPTDFGCGKLQRHFLLSFSNDGIPWSPDRPSRPSPSIANAATNSCR